MNLQLKWLREESGYAHQSEFADKIGVERRTYASWERGDRMMSLAQACMVADALGCSVDSLAGRHSDSLTAKERDLMARYRCMPKLGKEALESVAVALTAAVKDGTR